MGEKRKQTNGDGQDHVVPQPLVFFESAFGDSEAIKKLRFDFLRLCLGMGHVGAWGVGFKIRGETKLTAIQVLMCLCTRGGERSGKSWQVETIYAAKGEGGPWQVLGEEDPENFTHFRLLHLMQSGGYRYYDCEFSDEWTITEDDKEEDADISIHIIGSDDPLVIEARKLWETLIPAFRWYVADRKEGNAMTEAKAGPGIYVGPDVRGDLHRRKKIKDN